MNELKSSVVDPYLDPDPVFLGLPDPDPGKYHIRILYPKKDPCSSNFLKLPERQFRPNTFLSLIRIRISFLKTGSVDPGPEKNRPDPQHCLKVTFRMYMFLHDCFEYNFKSHF